MTIDSNEPLLSVVIPAYNEALRIPVAIRDACSALTAICGTAWEMIVVDDGSCDGTADVVQSLASLVPLMRLISHKTNQGKGAAVRTGVMAAVGRLILFADADGATPFREAMRLNKSIELGADVAVGSRLGRWNSSVRRTCLRTVISSVFAGLVRMLVGIQIHDTQCGFKLFRREAAHRLFTQSKETGYLFDIEILGLAERQRMVVAEVPVDWYEVPGSKVRFLRDSCKMLFGLLRIRRQIRRFRDAENVRVPDVSSPCKPIVAVGAAVHLPSQRGVGV